MPRMGLGSPEAAGDYKEVNFAVCHWQLLKVLDVKYRAALSGIKGTFGFLPYRGLPPPSSYRLAPRGARCPATTMVTPEASIPAMTRSMRSAPSGCCSL